MKNKLRYAKCLALYHINKGKEPAADAAFLGLKSPLTPKAAGKCMMYYRIIMEGVLGRRLLDPNARTAIEGAQRLRKAGYEVPKGQPLKPGDGVFKEHGSGGLGHVSFVFWGGYRIENSSADVDENGDARGIRTQKEFGDYDSAFRIPK